MLEIAKNVLKQEAQALLEAKLDSNELESILECILNTVIMCMKSK